MVGYTASITVSAVILIVVAVGVVAGPPFGFAVTGDHRFAAILPALLASACVITYIGKQPDEQPSGGALFFLAFLVAVFGWGCGTAVRAIRQYRARAKEP